MSDKFQLLIHTCIPSTNQYLIDCSTFEYNSLPVSITELQIKGRGRNSRNWYTSLAGSVAFSIAWRFNNKSQSIAGLTLTIAICLIRVINRLYHISCSIKWPNDILYKNCKLAGILVETRFHQHRQTSIIIGIGINTNLPSTVSNQLNNYVTDLYNMTGNYIDRNKLISSLLLEIYRVVSIFEVTGFKPFRNEWLTYHAFNDQIVELHLPNANKIVGTVKGIGECGELLVQQNSVVLPYISGEISLRSKI